MNNPSPETASFFVAALIFAVILINLAVKRYLEWTARRMRDALEHDEHVRRKKAKLQRKTA